jgi:hypothetical protein
LWADTSEAGDEVIPAGGSVGQVLVKQSATDYDTGWELRSLSWKPVPTYAYGHMSNTTLAMVLNRLYFNPILLPQATDVDQITVTIETAGTAGSVVRLGIYLPGTDGAPDALLVDAGTIDGTSTTTQSITIDETVSGLVYLSAVAQVAAPTIRAISSANIPEYSAVRATLTLASRDVFTQNSVSGALPANASTLSNNPVGVAMKLRIA